MQCHAVGQFAYPQPGNFTQLLKGPELSTGNTTLTLNPLRMTLCGADQHTETLQYGQRCDLTILLCRFFSRIIQGILWLGHQHWLRLYFLKQ
jgi:hypothetical protein